MQWRSCQALEGVGLGSWQRRGKGDGVRVWVVVAATVAATKAI